MFKNNNPTPRELMIVSNAHVARSQGSGDNNQHHIHKHITFWWPALRHDALRAQKYERITADASTLRMMDAELVKYLKAAQHAHFPETGVFFVL